jgi:predicted outer membrane repeat protein
MGKRTIPKTPLAISIFLVVLAAGAAAAGRIIYVDDDATGANDGSSWVDAYNYLQDALADDANSAEKPAEIRVAQGIYRPNQGLMAVSEFDWRTTTFQLINGVSLKGGFAGLGKPDPNARDIELYETILTGDLDGDDAEVADANGLLGHITRVENSYHVLTACDIDPNATLDGFTIIGGNANGEEDKDIYGGGIYCNNSFLEIINCTFQGNTSAKYGGAIHNHCLVLQRYKGSSKPMRPADDTPVNNHFSGGYRHGRQNDYENQTGIDSIPAPV